MMNTSNRSQPLNVRKSSLLAVIVLSSLTLCGCSHHQHRDSVTRADPAALPQPEGRVQGGEVRTPLPPPQIQGEATPQNVHEAAPVFPRLPDWASTFWDISSP